MSLNWFDFGIITVIFVSILISFFRGFLRETISLITWAAGILLALRFASEGAALLIGTIEAPMLRYAIAFVVIFLGVFITGLIVSALLKRGVDATGLSFLDRVVGAAFGAARGVLLVAVALMFVTMTSFKNNQFIVNSTLSPTFTPLVSWLDAFLPQQLQHFTHWIAIDDGHFKQEKKSDLVKTTSSTSSQET